MSSTGCSGLHDIMTDGANGPVVQFVAEGHFNKGDIVENPEDGKPYTLTETYEEANEYGKTKYRWFAEPFDGRKSRSSTPERSPPQPRLDQKRLAREEKYLAKRTKSVAGKNSPARRASIVCRPKSPPNQKEVYRAAKRAAGRVSM